MSWRLTDSDWNSWPDGLTDAQLWAQTANLGLDGIELGVYDASVELAPARLAALPGTVPLAGRGAVRRHRPPPDAGARLLRRLPRPGP